MSVTNTLGVFAAACLSSAAITGAFQMGQQARIPVGDHHIGTPHSHHAHPGQHHQQHQERQTP